MASEVYGGTMRGNPNHVSKAICFAIITILAAGCSKHEEPVTHTPPATIFTLGPAANSAFRSFPGEVSASRNGRLSFDVPGRLIEFPVYDGMIVREGGLIGRLDASDFVAQLDSARARFEAARDEFNRQVTLRNRNVIAQNELDRQREAFNVAEAGLRTAQKALDDTQLLAPFKGRVSHRFVRNFQSVQARELIVLLQDVSTLEIDIQLPENLMSALNRNATVAEIQPLIEAKAEFAALPGQSFDLRLFFLLHEGQRGIAHVSREFRFSATRGKQHPARHDLHCEAAIQGPGDSCRGRPGDRQRSRAGGADLRGQVVGMAMG